VRSSKSGFTQHTNKRLSGISTSGELLCSTPNVGAKNRHQMTFLVSRNLRQSFGGPKADEKALLASIENGFRAIKIKLGEGDLEMDVKTVRAVRAMIGPSISLMVDYNRSLDAVEASRRIARLSEFDLCWVEEPVKAEDLAGHARVRASASVPIQTGENWWFPRDMAKAIAAGASDFGMLDVMKIGGVTGWLCAMGQADAASLPISSHIFVEVSAHLLAVTPTTHWLEYLDIAGAILAEPYRVANGAVTAKGPGFGFNWDEGAIARFAADRN
jgi:mandelate racemase